jgi:hypothetical protein
MSEELTNEEKIQQILPKLTKLEGLLQAQDPELPNALRDVEKNLSMYPELAHILSDEQIRPIYSATMYQTKVVIAAKAAKAPKAKATSETANLLKDLL